MISHWPYILQAAFNFALLYTFYWLVLRKKTFYNLNRALLLLIMLFSIIMPALNFSANNNLLVHTLNTFEIGTFYPEFNAPMQSQLSVSGISINIKSLVISMYWIGVFLFSFRFILSLTKTILSFKAQKRIKFEQYNLVLTENNTFPFSFFKWIFLPAKDFNPTKTNAIIEHEGAHAKQWHTLDVLISEIFSIALWFVPLVYAFKTSLKNIHEYLADEAVVNKTLDTPAYLTLLSENTKTYALNTLFSNFYSLKLKSRITMLTKKRSPRLSKVQYLLVFPILAIIIQSSAQINQTSNEYEENSIAEVTVPASSTLAFSYPIEQGQYEVTWKYEVRKHPISKEKVLHKGIDYKATSGTKVMASAGGTVVKSQISNKGYGNVIAIQHNDGFYTLYAHLSQLFVEVGQTIKQNDVIGAVGNSGLSTGPHLHFEIRKDGKKLNPDDYLE